MGLDGSGVYVVGAPVADDDSSDADIGPLEVTNARRLFEGESAALAAAIITADDLRKLEDLLLRASESHESMWNRDRGGKANDDSGKADARCVPPEELWNAIDWRTTERQVLRLQMRIAKATRSQIEPPVLTQDLCKA